MSDGAAEGAPGTAGRPQVEDVPVVDAKVPEVPVPEVPRIDAPPLVRGNGAFLATLALVAVGFAYSAAVPQHWLRGVLVAAAGFALGAGLRLTLPQGRAGMLEIRSRGLDALCLGGVSVLIVTVGVLLPR